MFRGFWVFVTTVAFFAAYSSSSAADDPLTVAGDQFTACLQAHAGDAGLSSFDGGKSALALVFGACSHETQRFLNQCAKEKREDGTNVGEEPCRVQLGLAAQSYLKHIGR